MEFAKGKFMKLQLNLQVIFVFEKGDKNDIPTFQDLKSLVFFNKNL